MSQINMETNKHKNVCYEEKFSAFDFLFLFCATCESYNKQSYDKEKLIEFIYTAKKADTYDELLSDITISSNGIHIYSKNIDNAEDLLISDDIIYSELSDSKNIMFIDENSPVYQVIVRYEKYHKIMRQFVEQYINYESKCLEDSKSALKIKY